MKKIALITHIADADGAFPIILANLAFTNVDDFSCDVKEVDDTLSKVLEHASIYDTIYIVDLNITDKMAQKINQSELKDKIKIFDHHASNEFLNKYPFIHVVVERNGLKECGTTLFYEHLKNITGNEIFSKEVLKTMIELVRQVDTFDFTDEIKELALDFGNLYNIYGRENYIKHFIEYIKGHDTFKLDGIEKTLIEIEKDRVNRYIEEKMQHVKFATIDNIKVGIVFAEKNRSMLGHAMAKYFQDKIDIAIIIDVDRSVSYRAEKENVDITLLAARYDGGGHKHAGGSPLPIDIQEKIVEQIFESVKWQ